MLYKYNKSTAHTTGVLVANKTEATGIMILYSNKRKMTARKLP